MKTKSFSSSLVLVLTILGLVALLGACGQPTNQIPVISSVSGEPASVAPEDSSTITCIASDPDGDSLTYAWSATGGIISGTGKVITWTAPAVGGYFVIEVTVDDGRGGTADKSYTISVTVAANKPPVIVSVTANPKTIEPYTGTAITCVATDPDGDPLTYRWLSAEGDIEGTGNVIIWTAPLRLREYVIEVTVRDNKGGSITETCTVTVAPNELPVITSVSAEPATVIPDRSTTITCNAKDPEGNPLTYTWSATGGSISGTGKVITWTAPAVGGYFVIEVTVDDGRGGTATSSVTVQVQGVKITTTLKPLSSESGCVYSDGDVFPGWRVGDDNANNGIRAYLSFDISKITQVAEFRSAVLSINTLDKSGTPWADSGDLCIDSVEYGARLLQATDYELSGTRVGRFDSAPVTEIDLTTRVSRALRNEDPRFQIALYFHTETDNDNSSDYIRVTTAELTVHYVKKTL